MMLKLIQWLKPVIGAFIIIGLLQVTGLLGSVSVFAQTALLKTGVRNADADVMRKPEPFDFNFTIKTTDGRRVPFSKYKGKVVFLNLWATWCGPCRVEMPTIQSLYQKMDTTKVAFVMLSIDKDSDQPKILRYINQNKYTFPVFQPSGALTTQLDIPSIPTTFIINKQGYVVSKEVGTTNFDTAKFRKFLQGLTNQ